MSYQVLARKWRPSNFHEMVGQNHVLQALINGLDTDRLHHAYLFTGTRGVGKTSVARILAKCLNCETGVSSKPCGECSACLEISEGRFVDLIEVDAASRTKVEDTRELLENVQYTPSRGRYKVYLIDEVHMLSSHSFNALLKTLEEPPAHVKFLLATTDPQRLPATILSRCLQFSLKNLAPDLIQQHLAYVLGEEKIGFDDAGLLQIARAASGSMRDALSLSDQAIAFGAGNLSVEIVQQMLGSIDRQALLDILTALNAQDATSLFAYVESLAGHGVDLENLLQDLQSLLHAVAIAQVVPQRQSALDLPPEVIADLAQAMTAEDVQLFYQIALTGLRDFAHAPDARCGLEMTLLRMLAFVPAASAELLDAGDDADAALKKKPNNLAPISNNTAQADSSVPSVRQPNTQENIQIGAMNGSSAAADTKAAGLNNDVRARDVESISKPTANVKSGPAIAISEVVPSAPAPAANSGYEDYPELTGGHAADDQSEGFGQNDSVTSASSVRTHKERIDIGPKAVEVAENLSLGDCKPEHWTGLLSQLNVVGMAGNVASNCILLSVDDDHLSLTLDEQRCKIFKPAHSKQIQSALSEYFGQALQLTITPGQCDKETPFLYTQRQTAESQQAAEDAIYNDDNVQAMIKHFDAVVQEQSISPKPTKERVL